MHPVAASFIPFLFIGTCTHQPTLTDTASAASQAVQAPAIVNCYSIPLPPGYKRATLQGNGLGEWLRDYPFAKSDQVFLFNGEPSPNQYMQYKVLDLSIGSQNLQQCADAIMRLRSEYFFDKEIYDAIRFPARGVVFAYTDYLNGMRYKLHVNKLIKVPNVAHYMEPSKTNMHDFLQIVFAYCGTYSVYEASQQIRASEVMPGDMLIKPGSPGHAMIVMDIAVHEKTGEQIVLLAQGFMPAQSMHIVKNEYDTVLNPWYVLQSETVETPGFNFGPDCWYRWEY